jgi:hypothetical protein
MSYTPPSGSAADFSGASASYTPPAGSAANFADPETRYARPSSDITDGAWTPSTGADLYAMLDEETASDTDYILTAASSTCQIGLSAVTDPATSSGQVLMYRAQSSTGNTLIARLKQGATTIASATHTNVPATWTDYMLTQTAGECDAITNYSDLRIELEAA